MSGTTGLAHAAHPGVTEGDSKGGRAKAADHPTHRASPSSSQWPALSQAAYSPPANVRLPLGGGHLPVACQSDCDTGALPSAHVLPRG